MYHSHHSSIPEGRRGSGGRGRGVIWCWGGGQSLVDPTVTNIIIKLHKIAMICRNCLCDSIFSMCDFLKTKQSNIIRKRMYWRNTPYHTQFPLKKGGGMIKTRTALDQLGAAFDNEIQTYVQTIKRTGKMYCYHVKVTIWNVHFFFISSKIQIIAICF